MALDKPIVTENLPNLFGGGPPPAPIDPDAAFVQQIVDGVVAVNAKFSTILIDAFFDAQRLGWVAAMLMGVGVFATVAFVYLATLYLVDRVGERRRLDRLACDLANSAWLELSPDDIAEAEERWPREFAFARFVNERAPMRWPLLALSEKQAQRTAQAAADEWFERQRDEARA